MDGALRILTIADVPPDPNAGAAGTVYATNEALRALGHDVDAIWAEDLGPRRIRHGNLHSLLEQPRAYRRAVLRAVARRDYNAVIMSQPHAFLAARALKPQGFRGVVINRSHGVELRVYRILPEWHARLGVPESRFPPATRILHRLLRRHWHAVLASSDLVVVPSQEDRESLLEFAAQGQGTDIVVIPHGIAPPFEKDAVAIRGAGDPRCSRVLWVGQWSFIKGTDILLELTKTVLTESNLSVTWVTNRDSAGQGVSAADQHPYSRLVIHEWCSQKDLVPWFDNHGIFVFPSLMEGAAKAVLEAMARGLCVVATRTGGIRDYIRDGENGCLVDAGDVRGFVNRVLELSNDPEKMACVSRRAMETAQAYTWKRCARRFVQEITDRLEACAAHV